MGRYVCVCVCAVHVAALEKDCSSQDFQLLLFLVN
jgi:hypothetical protein